MCNAARERPLLSGIVAEVGEPTHSRNRGDPGSDPLRWAGNYLNGKIVTWETPMATFGQGASLASLGASYPALYYMYYANRDGSRTGRSMGEPSTCSTYSRTCRGSLIALQSGDDHPKESELHSMMGRGVTMDAISRTLQTQLRQEREVLTGEINKAMSQVDARVDDIEAALGRKLGEAVDMLQELSRRGTGETQALCRGVAPDGRAGGGQGAGGGQPEAGAHHRRMGSRSIGEETLQKAKDVIRELQIHVDAHEEFVPGLRRGYAILPFQPRAGESAEEARHRVQRAVQGVRTANGGTEHRGDCGSPSAKARRKERRRSPQRKPSGSSWNWGQRRTARGRVRHRNGLVRPGRICSGPKPNNDSVQDAGPGWIDVAQTARNLGMGEQQVQDAWQPLAAVLR